MTSKTKCSDFPFFRTVGYQDSPTIHHLLAQVITILPAARLAKSKSLKLHRHTSNQLTSIKRRLNSRRKSENSYNQTHLIKTCSKREETMNTLLIMMLFNPISTPTLMRKIDQSKWLTKMWRCCSSSSNPRRICGIVIEMIATNSVCLFLYSPKSLYKNEFTRVSRVEV